MQIVRRQSSTLRVCDADALAVFDRNFLDFEFLGRVLAKHNHFVLRVRDNAPAVQLLRTLDLTAADAEAGVASAAAARPNRSAEP